MDGPEEDLLERMRHAVADAVDDSRIGVAFSGGVDSTLISRICSDMGLDVTLLTVGFAGSHDLVFSRRIGRLLDCEHHTMEIDPATFHDAYGMVTRTITSENLSWIENCLAFHYVSGLAAGLGIRTVVTANGIDELFCGYDAYRRAFDAGEDALGMMMDEKIRNELDMMLMVDRVAAGSGVRILQPLLSKEFVRYAMTVPFHEKIRGADDMLRKHMVRSLAAGAGVPEMSHTRRKKALQYGTGIHKAVMRIRRSCLPSCGRSGSRS